MALMKCLSCGGVYEREQSGGMKYFHVCPPVTQARVDRAGKPLFVDLADVRPDDVLTVERDGTVVAVLAAALLPADIRRGDRDMPRANARDENVRITGVDQKGAAIVEARAEGAGAVAVIANDVLPA